MIVNVVMHLKQQLIKALKGLTGNLQETSLLAMFQTN